MGMIGQMTGQGTPQGGIPPEGGLPPQDISQIPPQAATGMEQGGENDEQVLQQNAQALQQMIAKMQQG